MPYFVNPRLHLRRFQRYKDMSIDIYLGKIYALNIVTGMGPIAFLRMIIDDMLRESLT